MARFLSFKEALGKGFGSMIAVDLINPRFRWDLEVLPNKPLYIPKAVRKANPYSFLEGEKFPCVATVGRHLVKANGKFFWHIIDFGASDNLCYADAEKVAKELATKFGKNWFVFLNMDQEEWESKWYDDEGACHVLIPAEEGLTPDELRDIQGSLHSAF